MESLLQEREDDEVNEFNTKSVFRANSRPADYVSEESLFETEKPGDVAIRVNKVNIAIGS